MNTKAWLPPILWALMQNSLYLIHESSKPFLSPKHWISVLRDGKHYKLKLTGAIARESAFGIVCKHWLWINSLELLWMLPERWHQHCPGPQSFTSFKYLVAYTAHRSSLTPWQLFWPCLLTLAMYQHRYIGEYKRHYEDLILRTRQSQNLSVLQ